MLQKDARQRQLAELANHLSPKHEIALIVELKSPETLPALGYKAGVAD